ncbi:MAG: translocase [Rhodosalinus sp.]
MTSQLFSNRYVMAGATFAAALGIGFVMQHGDPDPMAEATRAASVAPGAAVMQGGTGQPAARPETDAADADETAMQAPEQPVPLPEGETLSDIDFTSAAIAPRPPEEPRRLSEPPARDAEADLRQLRPATAGVDAGPRDAAPARPAPSCDVVLDARPRPNGMVRLALDAPCLPNERFTLHHNGLTFTAATDAAGKLALAAPALDTSAVFIAAFPGGEGAVAQVAVPEAGVRDRVVLQWRGDAGLQLHAFEGGAQYNDAGHRWVDAPGEPEAGEDEGFVVRLGDAAVAEPMMAEVYTFPAEMPETGVSVTVEAEVTEANCARELSAQTLGVMSGEAMERHELTFFMPDCAAVGDFLVLKNLYDDLKIAAR